MINIDKYNNKLKNINTFCYQICTEGINNFKECKFLVNLSVNFYVTPHKV